jgi:uncharacterized protein (DUF1015 family)
LLRLLQAHTSPVLALFGDREGHVSSLLAAQSRNEPMLQIDGDAGESHRLWDITDTQVISRICSRLADQSLYIADGHHRYESALAYQHERRNGSTSLSESEPFDFVLMTLVDFADPGIVISPAHRLVRGLTKRALDGLLEKLNEFFEVEELPLNRDDTQIQVNDLLTGEDSEVKLALYGLSKEHFFMLRLRDFSLISKMIPGIHSDLYKKLDVSVTDHVILEEMLGLSHDMVGVCIAYSYDGVDAINKVLDEEYQLTFLVRPVKSEIVKAIADSGDRMPRKSTYFYPKAPAGLVFYQFA